MIITNCMKYYLPGLIALLGFSLSANAYEVQFVNADDSEYKLLDSGQYEAAIERLERKAKRSSSLKSMYLTNLCTAYVVTKEIDKATVVCDQAVTLQGDYRAAALNSRGVLNALKGDFQAAAADFEYAGDKANRPLRGDTLWERRPSMRRFSTPASNFLSASKLAASNHVASDQRWAAIREKESEDLSASVSHPEKQD